MVVSALGVPSYLSFQRIHILKIVQQSYVSIKNILEQKTKKQIFWNKSDYFIAGQADTCALHKQTNHSLNKRFRRSGRLSPRRLLTASGQKFQAKSAHGEEHRSRRFPTISIRTQPRPSSDANFFANEHGSIFVVIWQLVSNHSLIRLKRFVSCNKFYFLFIFNASYMRLKIRCDGESWKIW